MKQQLPVQQQASRNVRGNKMVRIVVIVVLLIAAIYLYFTI